MGWNKDGSTIRANYCGKAITGVVMDSRVKYGGKVQYTVKANEPFSLPFCSELREVVLVDEDEVTEDFGVLPE